jgi:uncharacterized protein YpmB
MFTIREWKIIGVLLALFVFFTIAKFFMYDNHRKPQTAIDTQVNQGPSQEQVKVTADSVKALGKTPMAKATRNIFNSLNATNTKAREKILSKFPFKDVGDKLSVEKTNSKFWVINGTAINGVGAQVFILFPQYPDHVYRAAYQLTNSTTTPLILSDFEVSEDSQDTIKNFLNTLAPYANDPEMGI